MWGRREGLCGEGMGVGGRGSVKKRCGVGERVCVEEGGGVIVKERCG